MWAAASGMSHPGPSVAWNSGALICAFCLSEHEEQPILRRGQRAGPIDREPAGGSRFAIEAPRRHMLLERCLEGRDQDLKLLQGQAGEIEELRRAGLHVSEPNTGHRS